MLVAAFLWAGFKINSDAYYQRPDWRGVAAALGSAAGTRAIVAYDGQFATGPLSFYMHGIPWSGPGVASDVETGPVTITELDIVGDRGQSLAALPPGVSTISGRDVDGYLVYRFKLPATMGAQTPRRSTPVPCSCSPGRARAFPR